jgi:excisionase family DNA binding protein
MIVKLYTIRELSEILRCSLANAYALASSGRIPVVRIGAGGAGLRVRADDLEAWIESRRLTHEDVSR